MRKFLRGASIALGTTSIYLLWWVGPLLDPKHGTVYHWSGSSSALFVPVIVDFCAVWLILTLLFVLVRASGRMHVAFWLGMLLIMPSIALKDWAILSGMTFSHRVGYGLFGAASIAFALLLTLWRPAFEKRFARVVEFASTLLAFAAISGVVILCECAWFGYHACGLNATMTSHHLQYGQSTRTGKARVIWIVFDELSYQQVYERRFPGLQLPAFDELAAQATVFAHIIPAGIATERVLPALIMGEPVDEIRSSSDGKLSVHNPATRMWQLFNEHDTVFQDALNAGYSTGIVGWYNPYCRILPDVLNSCFWTFGARIQNGMVPEATLRWNLQVPAHVAGGSLVHRFASLFVPNHKVSDLDTELHISDYQKLSNAADRLLDDPAVGFILIHMPIPHPGGIYNRTSSQFAFEHSSYIDNLALADRCLAHIRSRLEQRGQWDTSTIVIMGDHSWRTKLLWEARPDWTEVEEVASQGGRFDDRPAFIVKLPRQRVGARIDAPFAALNTRRLLDALLTHNISSAEDLSAWTQQRH